MAGWWPNCCCLATKFCYLFGGIESGVAPVTDNDSYNYDSDSWGGATAMSSARYHQSCGWTETLIYGVGGRDSSTVTTTNQRFDGTSWTIDTALTGAISAAGDHYDGGMNVFGGNNSHTTLATHYRFAAGAWSSMTAMPAARESQATSVLSQTYLFQGFNGSSVRQTDTTSYDSAGDSFSSLTAIATAIRGHAAANDGDGAIALIGGNTAIGDVDTTSLYSIAGNSYSSGAVISAATQYPRGLEPLAGIGMRFGGRVGSSTVDTVQAYDFAANSWAAKSALPVPTRERLGYGMLPA